MTTARGSILIAAISGRALARAAANAGYVPLVADFAVRDTQALAAGAIKLADIARGFRWTLLEAALETLAARAPSPPVGYQSMDQASGTVLTSSRGSPTAGRCS